MWWVAIPGLALLASLIFLFDRKKSVKALALVLILLSSAYIYFNGFYIDEVSWFTVYINIGLSALIMMCLIMAMAIFSRGSNGPKRRQHKRPQGHPPHAGIHPHDTMPQHAMPLPPQQTKARENTGAQTGQLMRGKTRR